jgi:hypothetical protein
MAAKFKGQRHDSGGPEVRSRVCRRFAVGLAVVKACHAVQIAQITYRKGSVHGSCPDEKGGRIWWRN